MGGVKVKIKENQIQITLPLSLPSQFPIPPNKGFKLSLPKNRQASSNRCPGYLAWVANSSSASLAASFSLRRNTFKNISAAAAKMTAMMR